MIKVLIVVSGLVMFVPDARNNTVTALLVGTKSMPGMEHTPLLHLHEKIMLPSRIWDLEDQANNDVVIKVDVKGNPPIDLGAKKYFPHINQLTERPSDGQVDATCLAGTCVDAKTKARRVAAKVRFAGSWRTRPLQRCDDAWDYPVGFNKEIVESEFRKSSALEVANENQPPRRLATGLALEADIETLEDLHLEIKGKPYQILQEAEPALCEQWLGVKQPCVLLEVENWPTDISSCKPEDPDPCRPDRHFAMFYDLLVKPPRGSDRWLPYAISRPEDLACPTENDNKPAIRCPTTF